MANHVMRARPETIRKALENERSKDCSLDGKTQKGINIKSRELREAKASCVATLTRLLS